MAIGVVRRGAGGAWRGVLAALLLAALTPGTARAGPIVRFAPHAMEDARIVHEQFDELARYLEQASGVTLRWTFPRDNLEVIERFKAGEVDLAYLGPLPHVVLAREYPAARSLGCFRDENGEAGYTCSLMVAGDSDLTLERLRGLRVGLTQPYSTCGYLAVSQLLGSVGLRLEGDGNTYRYVGSHSGAALALARGEFDVVGVKTTIGRRYQHLDLKAIATSVRYPGFALVVNTATLDPATVAALEAAVLELDPARSPALAVRMHGWTDALRNGVVPPVECDYGGVEAALGAIPWPIPGADQ
jgi:phosphonate transport system substrate-binding protein